MADSADESYHILLYYKYVDLSRCRSEVAEWMLSQCGQLKLTGRVRVADDGVNVVVMLLSLKLIIFHGSA